MFTPEPDLRRIFRTLYLIRRFEERVGEIYPTDKIKSPVHLSIGQEAVAVGVCDALSADDWVSGTYRGHATYLARGGAPERMMAEMFGKVGGCARGKGGSMHLIDMAAGILGSSAVVGSTVPVAAGYALALQRQGRAGVVAAFFGDGATEEGCFYETLNFASLHKLPILFVCENNFLAIHEPITKRWATDRLTERCATFGMPAHKVESGDVLEIRAATVAALDHIRAGNGPAFLECHTYRWREHVGPGEDYDAGYRDIADKQVWEARDPVPKLAAAIPADDRRRIEDEVAAIIDAAVAFAEASPFPAADELMRHVYA